jgi:capsular polysaccharide transport system ATP-binding protein
MLRVRDLSKTYISESGPRRLFSGLSFDLGRNERLAILGRNGQGKSTLIKVLGGVVAPTEGSIKWSMTSSWPLGFGGGFQGWLTGLDNIRFIARIYDRPVDRTIALVEDFAQLGKQLNDQVRFYSSGMRARLAFGLSLAIEFECYLIDEVISVGDILFQSKCRTELFETRAHRSFIMASHDMEMLRRHCDRAIIVKRGHAKVFDDLDLAIDIYTSICEDGRYLGPSFTDYE